MLPELDSFFAMVLNFWVPDLPLIGKNTKGYQFIEFHVCKKNVSLKYSKTSNKMTSLNFAKQIF